MSELTPGGGYELPEPSLASRSIARTSRHHFNGQLVAGEGAGRVMRTESHLELLVLLVLLARPEIARIVEQPPAVEYTDEKAKLRRHVFDFLATRVDGKRVAIAVKPWKLAYKRNFAETLKRVAAQMPVGFADAVYLITDRHLDPVDVHNAWLLFGMRHPDPEADAAAARVIATMMGAMRLRDLAAATGLEGRGLRALLRLVGQRCLRPVSHERITPDTVFRKAGGQP